MLGWLVKNELGNICKEPSGPNFKSYKASLVEGRRKTTRSLGEEVSLPAEIRTKQLPNTYQKP
jgi:hypothetical protein